MPRREYREPLTSQAAVNLFNIGLESASDDANKAKGEHRHGAFLSPQRSLA